MKKFFIFLIIVSFAIPVFAEQQHNKTGNLPQGTFKKNHKGQIIQYDMNGKKIGIYKISSGRYIKVK